MASRKASQDAIEEMARIVPELVGGSADLADLPMAFEAAWGVDSAICVARPRIADNISLTQLGDRHPRLAHHLGPASCVEDSVMRDPAVLLFNRSYE